jgi:hypothetical protein
VDSFSHDSTSAEFAPEPGDLILAALWHYDSGHPGLGIEPAVPAQSTALAPPPSAAPPKTLVDRFEALRPAHQALILAAASALVFAGVGWILGASFGMKAAIGAAAVL